MDKRLGFWKWLVTRPASLVKSYRSLSADDKLSLRGIIEIVAGVAVILETPVIFNISAYLLQYLLLIILSFLVILHGIYLWSVSRKEGEE